MQPDGQISGIQGELDRERMEQAILETVLYSDLFDYPLTVDEIAHYLVEADVGKEQVQSIISASAWLSSQLSVAEGLVTLRGRAGSLAQRRRDRTRTSDRLWRRARVYGRILSSLPFIRMVAVTGALAMDNSDQNDDVDVLIVTAPNRVWLARALAVIVVYAGKISSNMLCPNYIISEEVLSFEPRTIYVAHEFVQMVPLYGHDVYHRMREANPWIRQMLPNADHPLHFEPEYLLGSLAGCLKRAAEWLLSGMLGERIETWEMRRKIRKFAGRNAGTGRSVVLDRWQVKGHFDDHGARISAWYRRRLEEYQIAARWDA